MKTKTHAQPGRTYGKPSGAFPANRAPSLVIMSDPPVEEAESAGPNGAPSRKEFVFRLEAPSAQQVLLAGEFTEWGKNPAPMAKDGRGVWSVSCTLTPGRHLYKFLVDGEWHDDPECHCLVPNTFGSYDSAIDL